MKAARKHTMISTRTLRLLMLAALWPALASSALAQDSSYFYGGLSLGESRARIDQERISASLLGAGLASTSFARDERSFGWRLFGGLQMNRYFALEASAFDLGKFSFNATTTPTGTLNGQIKLGGASLDLVGTLPLSDSFSLIGRVGANAARARDSFTGSGSVVVLNPNPSKRQVNPKFGAGLQVEVNPNFFVRGEAERYRVNDAVGRRGDVDVYSLSLVFPFGRAPAPAPRVAQVYVPPPPPPEPAPAIVPPPPPPPPPVVVAPPPAPKAIERRRVSFSAESLFGFDQAGMKPEGRAALDRFAAELQGAQFEVITVEGHTDRLGTPAYNQRLSAQRAEAVKAYLVSSGGFPASKVNAVGKGETSPATQPGTCIGNKPTPKLITCLQPDRRVEIEVVGTR
jgi:OOP family OmpA-OmpF porin